MMKIVTSLALLASAAPHVWAQAEQHPSHFRGTQNHRRKLQSNSIVIIGGATLNSNFQCATGYQASHANVMYATGGGCLPVRGDPDGFLDTLSVGALLPTAVSTSTLSTYDTAVLNVASYAMNCNTDNLSTQAKADLVAFVASGHKLIIFDSECYPGPVDYSWLPYPFTTANPGARGATGTLAIVEENTLSSNVGSYYIDAVYLGTTTDAVGDMNVMTTLDPNWCVDMSGTNALGITGPVHTYAKTGVDEGLYIYNGLDMDYLYWGDTELLKMWLFELQQPFNPSNLPCGVTVVGITLSPPTAENDLGEDHTVTASLKDLLGNPQAGISVTFTIISGPNTGTGGTGTTGSNGEVSFTYTGSGGIGTDTIEASFDNQGTAVTSQSVVKVWVAPFCELVLLPWTDQNECNVGAEHEVVACLTCNGVLQDGVQVDFAVAGANGGLSGSSATSVDGCASFVYSLVDPSILGTDTITAVALPSFPYDPASALDDDAVKVWVDTTPPEAFCLEGPNPDGQTPQAPGNGGQGQNQDGFYTISCQDNCVSGGFEMFVVDEGSPTVWGPYTPPTNIKYTQAPGGKPSEKAGLGVVDWHLKGNGDALVYCVDPSGNGSEMISCKVPPPPKV